MTDVGVNRVREVDRRRVDRKRDDLAFRREDEHLVLVEVDLDRIEERVRVLRLRLCLDEALQPRKVTRLHGGRTVTPPGSPGVLVAPVRGDPVLGDLVHLSGADLALHEAPVGPHHRRVQRLVEVELRHRDVVLEPALNRLPRGVDGAQGGVAVLHRIDQHPDADEVVDVVELLALDDHLLVDRPVVLLPAAHLGLDVQLGQPGLHIGERGGQVALALGRTSGHHVLELGVLPRFEGRKAEVLELVFDLADAEAMGERSVDVERLLGSTSTFPILIDGPNGAHVVQPVGQLDQQDAEVLRHRHEHLAHRCGLLRLLRIEVDPLELRNPIDDRGHVRAERRIEVVECDTRVLHHVVQDRGRERHIVHAELGQNHGDGERMGDVGLAGLPALILVRIGRHFEGLGDASRGRLRMMPAELIDERHNEHGVERVDPRRICGRRIFGERARRVHCAPRRLVGLKDR